MKRIFALLALAVGMGLGPSPILGPSGAVAAEGLDGPSGFSLALTGEAGWFVFREAANDQIARDWYARSTATLRLTRDEGRAAFSAKVWTAFDAAAGTWSLSLDEAWTAWRPLPLLEARLGRFPLAFGPCLAFNPANFLAAKNPLDPRAASRGLDGLSLGLRPIPLGGKEGSPPLATAYGALILPSSVSPNLPLGGDPLADLGRSGLHGRLTLVLPPWGPLGETELGLSGDLGDLEGAWMRGAAAEGVWDAGAWLSADLGGFVLGAEGGADSAGPAWALSLNKGLGDWLAVAELSRSEAPADWKAFVRLARALDGGGFSLSSLVDLDSLAARSILEASADIGDSFVLRASLAWNRSPELWEPPLAAAWSASIVMECYP